MSFTDEANRIDAAFIRFDYSGSGTLDESEVAAMPLGALGLVNKFLILDIYYMGIYIYISISTVQCGYPHLRFQFLGFPDPSEDLPSQTHVFLGSSFGQSFLETVYTDDPKHSKKFLHVFHCFPIHKGLFDQRLP
jgi:hypothetical protein